MVVDVGATELGSAQEFAGNGDNYAFPTEGIGTSLQSNDVG